jgi:hypothetical protein
MHISEILNQIEKPKQRSKRAELTQQLYDIYMSDTQVKHRKLANWKRYCAWCRENRIADGKEAHTKFKKSRQYIKTHNIKTFVYFLSVIPTSDLDYLLSQAKDMNNRDQNFSGYLFANLTGKTKTNE